MPQKYGRTKLVLLFVVLAALLIGFFFSIASVIQSPPSCDRTASEIAAISAAMESFHADNGVYPHSIETDQLDPRIDIRPGPKYAAASLTLYKELSGDLNADFTRSADERKHPVYFDFERRKSMLKFSSTGKVEGIVDPNGEFYGYSTARSRQIRNGVGSPSAGYNPTYDLWSTYKSRAGDDGFWFKNW